MDSKSPLFEEPAAAAAAVIPLKSNIPTYDKLKSNPPTNNLQLLNKKLNSVYQNATELSNNSIEEVKSIVNNFLQGNDINLKFYFGHNSKINTVIIRALATIYVNSNDNGLQIKAKHAIKNSLNPITNKILGDKIIEVYNNSKFNKYPIKKIDSAVTWALKKTFEYNFETYWNYFLRKNIGPNNSFISGNFIGLVYDGMTGGGGYRINTWFGQYYNDYKTNPELFSTGGKAEDPLKQKLDRSKHTVSDVINYVYSIGKKFNPKIIDNFNSANQEILIWLSRNAKPSSSKIFEYVVIKKLDTEEIIKFYKKHFKTPAFVIGAFSELSKNKKSVTAIDDIYKKYKLKLPSFSTWKSSDFAKGPSDRGELKATGPEIGIDKGGNLSKIKWDKDDNKVYSPLEEMRMYIRSVINECINNKTN